MSETKRGCYRSREDSGYYQRQQHVTGCDDDTCRGCATCPERHCTATGRCSWHVSAGELTCGRCLSVTRNGLRTITDLSALTLTEALDEGVDSEAANLAGPAADPRTRSELRLAQRRHLSAWEAAGKITEAQHLDALTSMASDDPLHPHSVVTRWHMMLAEDWGHDLPAKMRLSDSAAYLDRNLYRLAQDPEQDFADFATDVRRVRQHLEVVLHNDDRPDRGAPCPECTSEETGVGPRLIRKWDDKARDDRYDEWRCPRCGHVWSHHDYNAYVQRRVS